MARAHGVCAPTVLARLLGQELASGRGFFPQVSLARLGLMQARAVIQSALLALMGRIHHTTILPCFNGDWPVGTSAA